MVIPGKMKCIRQYSEIHLKFHGKSVIIRIRGNVTLQSSGFENIFKLIWGYLDENEGICEAVRGGEAYIVLL